MNPLRFGKEYGENVSGNYERFFVPSIGKPLAVDLIERAKLQPGERVLDVACGTGIVARIASEKVGNTGYVAGLDINPGMISVARKVSPYSIEWFESGAEDIPAGDNTFDVVLCQISMQFVADKLKVLKEMYRVLNSGGRLIISSPGKMSQIYVILKRSLEEIINPESAAFVTKVFSFHNTEEVKQLLTRSGYKDISVTKYEKTFKLPASKDFLWQYINSTPLSAITAGSDESILTKLENSILSSWSELEVEGKLTDKLSIMVANAKK